MRLTAIVPCRDAEAYVTRCLDSLLAHPGPGLEVIAVDDASTDGTGALLDARAEHEARLQVVRLAVSDGPGNARNAALKQATGDVVWFVDADDWVPPGAVGDILEALSEHPVDVLIVDHAEVFRTTVVPRRTVDKLGPLPSPTTLAEHPELLRLAPSGCTKIVRRDLLERTGIRFPRGRYEDAYYSASVLMNAASIAVLDRVCYFYRQDTPGSTTSTPAGWHFDIFDQYERLFHQIDEAGGRLDEFRSELFRVMTDHYLVVLGHRTRVPARRRREFFRRVVRDVDRLRPREGYPIPTGMAGVKHRLIRLGAYPSYSALRWWYRRLPRRSAERRGR
jgi:CDP-glycerol glycerophosphotransferase